MSITTTLVNRPITLDQLVALCDEIAALARAGVPLDRGLVALAREMPGRLGTVAGDIGQRLAAGESLAQIVGHSDAQFPPAFRAVIAAGQRSGNLSAAVQDVARTARRLSQLRMTLGSSLLYPLLVLLVALGLLIFTLSKLTPVMLMMLVEVRLIDESTQAATLEFVQTIVRGLPLIAPIILIWAAWVWYRSGQVARGIELHPLLAWSAVGKLRQLHRTGRTAALCDLLALLIEHQVPLDEAVTLASAGVGSTEVERGGRELAERVRRGQLDGKSPAGFPPLLGWTLVAGAGPQLAATLRRTAQVYRDETIRQSQRLAMIVPLATTACIAVLVVLYAAITLGPWLAIMQRLANALPI